LHFRWVHCYVVVMFMPLHFVNFHLPFPSMTLCLWVLARFRGDCIPLPVVGCEWGILVSPWIYAYVVMVYIDLDRLFEAFRYAGLI